MTKHEKHIGVVKEILEGYKEISKHLRKKDIQLCLSRIKALTYLLELVENPMHVLVGKKDVINQIREKLPNIECPKKNFQFLCKQCTITWCTKGIEKKTIAQVHKLLDKMEVER